MQWVHCILAAGLHTLGWPDLQGHAGPPHSSSGSYHVSSRQPATLGWNVTASMLL